MDKDETLTITAGEQLDLNLEPLDTMQISTLNLNDLINSIDIKDLSSFNPPYSSYTISNPGAALQSGSGMNGSSYNTYITNTTGPYNTGPYNYSNVWQTIQPQPNTLQVNGDAEFEGDIKWKGRSLGEMLETIEKRLSILVPDPKKLEHYEALKKAYEHYKTLEALCDTPAEDEDK
ncbi:MAG: hypothetical protein EBU90_07885 [Proteobacteria bacterium]|nr:hypothetical protein [Pseudomonadota bacterium]NBP14120.1 hypothetical protein [bacterium]